MKAKGFLHYRLKYCWPKVIYYCMSTKRTKQEIKKLGVQMGENQKSGEAMAYPVPPLASPLIMQLLRVTPSTSLSLLHAITRVRWTLLVFCSRCHY